MKGFCGESILSDDIENKSQFRPQSILIRSAGTSIVDEVIPLNRLIVGQSAQVSRILGPVEHVHRLEEFGLRSGATIEMFRAGTPCIVRLDGGKVCLRADKLLDVLVKRNGTSC